jgi:conjugal transfer pilus assembly protein TraU
LAARVLAGLHRRGLAWKTTGNGSLCGGTIYPMLPKQQYRMSMLFPMAEASSKIPGTDIPKSCCHYIGETPFKWGEWRTIPGTGEDYVYMLWRWTDCCLL